MLEQHKHTHTHTHIWQRATRTCQPKEVLLKAVGGIMSKPLFKSALKILQVLFVFYSLAYVYSLSLRRTRTSASCCVCVCVFPHSRSIFVVFVLVVACVFDLSRFHGSSIPTKSKCLSMFIGAKFPCNFAATIFSLNKFTASQLYMVVILWLQLMSTVANVVVVACIHCLAHKFPCQSLQCGRVQFQVECCSNGWNVSFSVLSLFGFRLTYELPKTKFPPKNGTFNFRQHKWWKAETHSRKMDIMYITSLLVIQS